MSFLILCFFQSNPPSGVPTGRPTLKPTTEIPTTAKPTFSPTTHVPTPIPKCLNCVSQSPTLSFAPTQSQRNSGISSTSTIEDNDVHTEVFRVISIMVILFGVAAGMTYWGWLRSQAMKGTRKLRVDEEEYQSDHSEIALNVMHDYSSDPKYPPGIPSPRV